MERKRKKIPQAKHINKSQIFTLRLQVFVIFVWAMVSFKVVLQMMAVAGARVVGQDFQSWSSPQPIALNSLFEDWIKDAETAGDWDHSFLTPSAMGRRPRRQPHPNGTTTAHSVPAGKRFNVTLFVSEKRRTTYVYTQNTNKQINK